MVDEYLNFYLSCIFLDVYFFCFKTDSQTSDFQFYMGYMALFVYNIGSSFLLPRYDKSFIPSPTDTPGPTESSETRRKIAWSERPEEVGAAWKIIPCMKLV